jgi:hypothetical protein
LSEKDGWLHLGAYGFTFSSPVLRVKLSGVSKALPKTNTSQIDSSTDGSKKQSPMSTNKKSYTVTCIKGKLVKKIIAPKPNCPTGWKKK